MKRQWYAVSASASSHDRKNMKFTSVSAPFAFKAVSNEEACGMAIKRMKELFPPRDGWYEHQASAVEVPLDTGERHE